MERLVRLGSWGVLVSGLLSACGGGGGGCSLGALACSSNEAANQAPVAQISVPATASVSAPVQLDGAGSRDPEGQTLTYRWELTAKPSGSNAALSTPAGATASLTPDIAGSYVVSLTVQDTKSAASTSRVTIVAGAANAAPVAHAGADGQAVVGSVVQLNGSQSRDPDGDLIGYEWRFASKPAGSSVELRAANTPLPTFTPDISGTYGLELRVTDGKVTSSAASVKVTAGAANVAPVAVAGLAQSVVAGSAVALDGSGSRDANGDLLTYQWGFVSRPTGSAANLRDPTRARPEFLADVAGDYVLSLVVKDAAVSSAPAYVTITAAAKNATPVAVAGNRQSVAMGATVTLDGSASQDANGDLLTYAWTMVSKPQSSAASLRNASAVKPDFVADVAGDYVFSLTVSDGVGSSPISFVTVTAAASNAAPVASAGANQSVIVGSTVILDGTGSSDVNGDLLGYTWTTVSKPAGSAAVLLASNTVRPQFTADQAGAYVFSLVVSDGRLSSSSVVVVVDAAAPSGNAAPVAVAGVNQSVLMGSTVILDGSGSTDANNDLLTYAWTVVSRPGGSTANLVAATTVRPQITVDQPGAYVFGLVVSDGRLSSNTSVTVVNVAVRNAAPVAVAGAPQTVRVGRTVTLDGGNSTDANGDRLSYTWSLMSRPGTSVAAISALAGGAVTNSRIVTLTPDVAGVFVAGLVVSDGTLSSEAASVVVTALPNTPPVANAGANLTAAVGATVRFNGAGSQDADGDAIVSYTWTVLSRPTASNPANVLIGANTSAPFFVPDAPGVYVMSLTVSDGTSNSVQPALVTLTVN